MKLSLTLEEKHAVLLLMGANACYDEDSLKKAYRCKVKKSHPDMATSLGKDPSLMKMQFQELNDAFNLLLEKIKNNNNEYTKKVYRNARSGFYKPTSNSTRKKQTKTQGSWQQSKRTKNYKAGSPYTAAGTMTGKYYTGPLPVRILRFAEYLYYTGEISWDEMVHSLVWQYQNRPKLGELAESTGLIGQNDILFIIKNRKFSEMFGEAAVRLDILDKKTLDKLVRQQKMIGLPIGRFFLEKNIFSEEQLFRKLTSNRRHNLYHSN